MSPASRIPLRSLPLFAIAKAEEQLGRFRDNLARVAPAARNGYAHGLLLAGFAGIAYGCWACWHPLGGVAGGWLLVRLATMVAEEKG